MQLNGIPALVTGGGSGLGAATARALADAGAKVAILDLNEDGARSVAGDIGGLAIRCDVASAQDGETAVTRAAEAHGPARVLVSCAGIGPARKVVSWRSGLMPLDEFRRAIEINLIGTFNILRLFAASAMELDPVETGERGVAINTASVAAYEGQIGQTAYAASKGGIMALTLPAAREFAPVGIRVCTIAPGIFETAMLRALPEPAQQSLGAAVPFPARLGRPEEFARLALAIIDNPMLNGETIRIDGALRMAPK